MSDTWACERCGAPMTKGAVGDLCHACLMGGVLEQQGESAMFFDFDPDQPDATEALERMLVGYKDLTPIGHGGMGVVYKATHERLDRTVAIKVMRPRLADDPEFTDRFLRESRALAGLDHANIVRVYDFGEHAGMCFLVMEHVDGASLRDMMRDGPLAPDHALALVPQVCDALQYAHAEGVVHRDIKPENILVDRAGRVKLLDFGLAKLRGDVDYSLTKTGLAMGTPHYMAPEQRSAGLVDHRADIYSLGVMFYEMLTGHLPTGRFPYPSEERAVDARLDEVVLRAMEHDPARRYQHASEVRSEVEQITASAAEAPAAVRTAPDQKSAVPPPPPLPKKGKREKTTLEKFVFLILIAVVLMIAVPLVMFLLFAARPVEPVEMVELETQRTYPQEQHDAWLRAAVHRESYREMRDRLRKGGDPNHWYTREGKTTSPLIESAKVRPEMVQVLLAAGALPDDENDLTDVTPLCAAAARGKTESVRQLLAFGALSWRRGAADIAKEGVAEPLITPLEWALREGKSETAEVFIAAMEGSREEQLDVRERMGVGGPLDFTLFTLALDGKHGNATTLAARLHGLQADIDATDPNDARGDTVLIHTIKKEAKKGDDIPLTRWLLSAGVDVNKPGHGTPPLIVAFRTGAVSIVRALVANKADVNAPSGDGSRSILEYAREYAEHYDKGVLMRDAIEAGKREE